MVDNIEWGKDGESKTVYKENIDPTKFYHLYQLMEEFESKKFNDVIWNLLGKRFRKLNNEQISFQTTVRFIGPSKEPFVFRGPHLDAPVVLINGLLYLKDSVRDTAGGSFALYSRKDTKNKRFDDLANNRAFKTSSVDLVKEIPYGTNHMVFFENSIDTIHGVLEREKSPYPRIAVGVEWSHRDSVAYSFSNRHKVYRFLRNSIKPIAKSINKKFAPVCIKGHSFILRKIGRNSLVVDIGMNRGEFCKTLMKERAEAVFCGVEPESDLFRDLDNQNQFKVKNTAVGGYSGTGKIFFIKSKRDPEYFGSIWSTINDPDWENLESIDVDYLSLDEYVNQTLDEEKKVYVDLLKMDIEGAEIAALNSLSVETLKRIKQITLEFHDFMFPSQKTDVTNVCNFLQQQGYYFFDFSLNEDRRDVLFIRKELMSVGESIFYKCLASMYVKKTIKKKGLTRKVALLFYRHSIS
jgi:FkbM family methyltransferase